MKWIYRLLLVAAVVGAAATCTDPPPTAPRETPAVPQPQLDELPPPDTTNSKQGGSSG